MGHSVITCGFCKSMVMEGRNTWECDCGAKYKEGVDGKWSWVMGKQKTAKVVNLFNKKEDVKKSPEEIVENFHAKLDEVLDQFQTLSVMEKYEVMQSVVEMNKTILSLYFDLKKRHEHTINN